MDGGGEIAMDGGSGDGQQWWHNGQRDGEAIAMGNGMAVAQWMAQWVTDDCPQYRNGIIGGNARSTAAAIGDHDGRWQLNYV